MRFHGVLALAAIIGTSVLSSCGDAARLDDFKHIVVIYQENHSFDNLFGLWGKVDGEPVEGFANAETAAAQSPQVRQDGTTPYTCLLQDDVNLTSPSPLATTCTDTTGATPFESAFVNKPFKIDAYISSRDTTCPAPGERATNGKAKGTGLPGGCTRDLVHRYYIEQYQINGGKQNRYVTGSDAAGLSMGYYDTTKLPIYKYLNSHGAPKYVIADHFFQGAFGGSFLNHQWLIAGAAPVFAGATNDGGANDLHSVVDANGMPTSTPLYASPLGAAAKPGSLTASCNPPAGRPATPKGIVCGDYAINTIQPISWPYQPGTAAAKRLPLLTNPTIGDRLTAEHVDWAWYSGGWSNANGLVGAPGWTNGSGPACSDPNADTRTTHADPADPNSPLVPLEGLGFPHCPDKNFQYHHQPFNYFANFAADTEPHAAARAAHLLDEAEFIKAAHEGRLKPVSFIKPVGEENEHPGYTSESEGSSHLVDLIKAIVDGPDGKDTLIVVTYDEFGGAWDHVPPPPHGRHGSDKAAADAWGPGTRIPTLLVSGAFAKSGVAHGDFDTTSIIKMIEDRFHLQKIKTRPVRDLAEALKGIKPSR
jgi:phospholipase C